MTDTTNLNDDVTRFLEDLNRGLRFRMVIAPAAPWAFKDFPRVLGYLHSLGVEAFYPVLPYADITVWAYYRILREHPAKKMIASACIGMNRYLKSRRGTYTEYLCSVFSPLLCSARYLKTYLRLEEPLAFLSPCTLKKNEFVTGRREELVRYNITIKALHTRLIADAVDVGRYEPCVPETGHNGKGLTLAAFGGIGKALEALLPDIRCRVEQGMENTLSYLTHSREFRDSRRPLFFEPYACEGGCIYGPGVGPYGPPEGDTDFLKSGEPADPQGILNLFSYYDETLKLEDFCHHGETGPAGTP
jgi:iron only hydrogenase large subunit-like protein